MGRLASLYEAGRQIGRQVGRLAGWQGGKGAHLIVEDRPQHDASRPRTSLPTHDCDPGTYTDVRNMDIETDIDVNDRRAGQPLDPTTKVVIRITSAPEQISIRTVADQVRRSFQQQKSLFE